MAQLNPATIPYFGSVTDEEVLCRLAKTVVNLFPTVVIEPSNVFISVSAVVALAIKLSLVT